MYNWRNIVTKPNPTVISMDIESFLFKFVNSVIFTLKYLKSCNMIKRQVYTIAKKSMWYIGNEAASA